MKINWRNIWDKLVNCSLIILLLITSAIFGGMLISALIWTWQINLILFIVTLIVELAVIIIFIEEVFGR